MVSKFQFYLDGTLVQDPKGWEDLDTTIKRDYSINGLFITQEATLEFYGDGYTYIKDLFDSSGFCDYIEIEIRQTCDQQNYEQVFKGNIFLSDCVFDLMRCSVKCKTVDDGYYARINNNKSIKAKINVARSKNDVAITAATPINVRFFNCGTGAYLAEDVECYTIYEVFKYLVAFMTDGQVAFTSDIFGTGGEYEGVVITTGYELRNRAGTIDIPELSFSDVFQEVHKKLRLGFAIERIAGVPTLRIEDAEYFYSQSSSITLSDAKEVSMQMDTSQLYSIVHLGSSITDNSQPDINNGIPHFPEDIEFLGFKDETYHTIGTCNVDTTLELFTNWIVSSNVIEQIRYNFGYTNNDSDIIMVNTYDDAGTQKAVQGDWLNLGFYFYNEIFTNENVTKNWIGGIPADIARFLGNGNDEFEAERSFTTLKTINAVTTITPAEFDTEISDVNGNYDNTTYKYTIPSSGAYTFEASLKFRMIDINGPASPLDNGTIVIWLKLFDSGNNLIASSQYGASQRFVTGTIYDYRITKTFNCDGTDPNYVIVEYYFSQAGGDPAYYMQLDILSGCYFKCIATATGGGVYDVTDPEDYKIKKYSFNYPITYTDFKTIKADPKKLITFTTNNNVTATGWIDELKYFHHNKTASVKLITN